MQSLFFHRGEQGDWGYVGPFQDVTTSGETSVDDGIDKYKKTR
ncbi:hypothetical protein [Paracidovorax wautersii]